MVKRNKNRRRIMMPMSPQQRRMNLIAGIVFFICMCFIDVVFLLIFYSDVMNPYIDQYATIDGSKTYVSQTYTLEQADNYKLDLFNNAFADIHIKQTTIDLKIINSPRNEIEIESSENLLNQIKLSQNNQRIGIRFDTESYNLLNKGNDSSFDYDYGLIVKTKRLNIKVFAPIVGIEVFPKVNINAELVKSDSTYLEFNEVNGLIHGIDAQKVKLATSYSNLTIKGNCQSLELYLLHGARINAKQFKYDNLYEYSIISSTFFSKTYFDGQKYLWHFNGGVIGTIISIFILIPVFMIVVFITSIIVKRIKRRKLNN